MIIHWGMQKIYRESKKQERVQYFLDTDTLSPEMGIAVDIALEYQNHFKKPDLFIPLHQYFIQIDSRNEDLAYRETGFCCVMGPFWLDENNIFLTESEFAEILYDLPPMVRVAGGYHVPKKMSEETARKFGFAEFVPIRESDFVLNEDQIYLLNTFAKDAITLKNSSLYMHSGPVAFQTKGNKTKIILKITDEQFGAFITWFRKLFAPREPANFKKVAAILTDSLVVSHPIRLKIKSIKEKFDHVLSQKITENKMVDHLYKKNQSEDVTTGEQLINAVLYTQYLHQGDDKTQKNINQSEALSGMMLY